MGAEPTRWGMAAVAAFLLGSLPWGLWLGRVFRGVDVRRHGSGNLGATNVYRVLGPGLGVSVLLLDILKGGAAVWAARWIVAAAQPVDAHPISTPSALGTQAALLALAASVLGHSFTPFARFRGGKGVATAAGAWGMIAPGLLGIALGVWMVVFLARRIVSLASISAALALPLAAGLLQSRPLADPVFWVAMLTCALLLLRHRGNLIRLLRREERPLALRGSARGADPNGEGRG